MLLTFGCLVNIFIFFNSRKFRILVFYLREHSELMYILQNRVEYGIVYFFWKIIFRAVLFLILGCLDDILIFFNSRKIRISAFYMREHIDLVYILQNRVEIRIISFFLTDCIQCHFLFDLGSLDII